MKTTRFVLCLSLSLLLTACAKELRVHQHALPLPEADRARDPADELYRIGPGDTLEVTLLDSPSLSGPARVRPDGFITLPFVNEVHVAGFTTTQVREQLQEQYKKFVKNPVVTIRVIAVEVEIFVIGNVARPGAYPAKGSDTVLQVLTRAGGLNPFADRRNIRVFRRGNGKVTEYVIDYDAIVSKGDMTQDILLQAGDQMVVR